MKAIKEENQAALDHFMKNEFWRKYYEDAPSVAKELIENGFRSSLDYHVYDDIPMEEQKRRAKERESRMTVEDLRYLAERGHHPMMRKHYAEVLKSREEAK